MRICKICGEQIPRLENHNGKEISLAKRKYCIKCSPIGERRIWRGKEISKYRMGGKRKILEPIEHICKTCGRYFKAKTRNTECTTCSCARKRNERKNKAIELLGGECKICGYSKCSRALVFHHNNIDEKEFQLSNKWQLPWEKIEKELNKCSLLCCRCHEEIHSGIQTIS